MVIFVPLGCNCSPAMVLRKLGLRQVALPFDWTAVDVQTVIRCLKEDFANFHKNLESDKQPSIVTILNQLFRRPSRM